MPSQCCVLSYKAVPFLHSARATRPRSPPWCGPRLPRRSHGRSPLKARCPGPRPAAPGRVLRAPPAAAARGRRGRAHARAGGGGEEGTGGGAAGRGRGAGGPATVASAETATPQSSSRLQTRASRHAAGPGYTPGATARSCVKARQKRHISTARKPSAPPGPPRPHSRFGSGRGGCTCCGVPRARE